MMIIRSWPPKESMINDAVAIVVFEILNSDEAKGRGRGALFDRARKARLQRGGSCER